MNENLQQPNESDEQYQARVDDAVRNRKMGLLIDRQARAELDIVAEPELRFLTLDDIRARPQITWLADRFIARDTVAALSGPSGAGKSFVAVELACCIATGRAFLGERPVRQGRVLYIAGEGIAGLGQRVVAWEAAHGTTVPSDGLHFLDAGVNLSNEGSVNRLIDGNAEHRFDLIIVDTFSTLGGVRDENAAPEVATVIAALVRVRQANPGSAVLILHHTGKDADRGSRGSSAFQANVDTVWILRGESAAFSLSSKAQHGGKMKDAPTDEIVGLRLDTQDRSAVVVGGAATLDADSKDRLLTAIRTAFGDDEFRTGQITDDAMLADLRISERTAKNALRNLTSSGALTQVRHGAYRLAESATTG
ncbi:AAA family ATPase [Curtobacterium sp. MCBD17_035]|uniref:AAA family ATPase n=1 Tax=Curtobacterium sp. MCBD17_035 TaxID=2175673 RepID=UPI000DAA7E01|nr:AAA family ATPase [Curtobacterium sp. MCBD17_035]WIB68791.1 AAA family ATPase [Curtobacterium sp. MCBD17_035]